MMAENIVVNVKNAMTPDTIRDMLPKAKLPPGLARDRLSTLNTEIGERALMRLAVNESGGLPGLPVYRQTPLRRFFVWMQRRRQKKSWHK